MKQILVLNGPNLNLLGIREPNIYGNHTLEEINYQLQLQAKSANFKVTSYQTNDEAEFINAIHQAFYDKVTYIIMNPAAFTHTSIAIRDALLAVNIPFIEVHISNIYNREHFRRVSYFSDIALGMVNGLGTYGYTLALQAIIQRETNNGHS